MNGLPNFAKPQTALAPINSAFYSILTGTGEPSQPPCLPNYDAAQSMLAPAGCLTERGVHMEPGQPCSDPSEAWETFPLLLSPTMPATSCIR